MPRRGRQRKCWGRDLFSSLGLDKAEWLRDTLKWGVLIDV